MKYWTQEFAGSASSPWRLWNKNGGAASERTRNARCTREACGATSNSKGTRNRERMVNQGASKRRGGRTGH